jgi:hypothetical protein
MSLKIFLVLIILGTILAWITFGLVVFNLDPEQAGIFGFLLFYLNLFLALSGTIFIVSDLIKARFFKYQSLYHRFKVSLRHSIFFTVLILGWAFLKSQGILRWWNILLLILSLTILEFFFISLDKQKRQVPAADYDQGQDFTDQTTI